MLSPVAARHGNNLPAIGSIVQVHDRPLQYGHRYLKLRVVAYPLVDNRGNRLDHCVILQSLSNPRSFSTVAARMLEVVVDAQPWIPDKRKVKHVQPTQYHGQLPDTKPGNYYVSIEDGSRHSLLLGPFSEHAAALAMVDQVKSKACELDSMACFYGFGTCRTETTKPGVLNDLFAEVLA